MRYIEQKLIEYNEKKLQKEIIEARITAYKFALDHPEIRINEFPISNPFAIKDGKSVGISIVEVNTLSEEKMRELLKNEIEDEESRINHLRLEMRPYELVLKKLSLNDNYLIECKLFSAERLNWKDIEISYNHDYKKEKNYKYIPERTLRDNYYKTLDKLEKLLGYGNES